MRDLSNQLLLQGSQPIEEKRNSTKMALQSDTGEQLDADLPFMPPTGQQ